MEEDALQIETAVSKEDIAEMSRKQRALARANQMAAKILYAQMEGADEFVLVASHIGNSESTNQDVDDTDLNLNPSSSGINAEEEASTDEVDSSKFESLNVGKIDIERSNNEIITKNIVAGNSDAARMAVMILQARKEGTTLDILKSKVNNNTSTLTSQGTRKFEGLLFDKKIMADKALNRGKMDGYLSSSVNNKQPLAITHDNKPPKDVEAH